MNGVGFETLARTPVPNLPTNYRPPPPPPPHPPRLTEAIDTAAEEFQLKCGPFLSAKTPSNTTQAFFFLSTTLILYVCIIQRILERYNFTNHLNFIIIQINKEVKLAKAVSAAN